MFGLYVSFYCNVSIQLYSNKECWCFHKVTYASIWLTLGYCSSCVFFCKKNFFQDIMVTCSFLKALKRSVLKKAWERETHRHTHTPPTHKSTETAATGKSHKSWLHTFFTNSHTWAHKHTCALKKGIQNTNTKGKNHTHWPQTHTSLKGCTNRHRFRRKKKETNKKWKDKYTSLHLNLLLPKRQQLSAVFCGRLSTTG